MLLHFGQRSFLCLDGSLASANLCFQKGVSWLCSTVSTTSTLLRMHRIFSQYKNWFSSLLSNTFRSVTNPTNFASLARCAGNAATFILCCGSYAVGSPSTAFVAPPCDSFYCTPTQTVSRFGTTRRDKSPLRKYIRFPANSCNAGNQTGQNYKNGIQYHNP